MTSPVSRYPESGPLPHNGGSKVDPQAKLQFTPDQIMVALLERSRDCVEILGIDGTLDFMNCGGVDTLSEDKFKGARGQLWWTLWPEHTQATVKAAFEKARMGEEMQFTAECPTEQGNLRTWTVTLKPMLTCEGGVAGVVCKSRDIETSDCG
ncbi:MAG: PAS domain-containing protein [Marinomonas sp.]